MHIGENIKLIRQVWGLKQPQFAKLLDATTAMIKSYENGNAQPKKLVEEKLSELSGIKLEELRNSKISIKSIKMLGDKNGSGKDLASSKQSLTDRAMVIVNRRELAKLMAKVYGKNLQEVLNELEENTTIQVNELLKQV